MNPRRFQATPHPQGDFKDGKSLPGHLVHAARDGQRSSRTVSSAFRSRIRAPTAGTLSCGIATWSSRRATPTASSSDALDPVDPGYTKIGQAGRPTASTGRSNWTSSRDARPSRVSSPAVRRRRLAGAGVSFRRQHGQERETSLQRCLDDVHIDDRSSRRGRRHRPSRGERFGQPDRYFPRLEKTATVRSPNPAKWELQIRERRGRFWDDDHFRPRRGVGRPGFDRRLFVLDKEGAGYTLKVGSDVSHPFDIGNDLYRKLKVQALAYFITTAAASRSDAFAR